jgi:hypothetical protein
VAIGGVDDTADGPKFQGLPRQSHCAGRHQGDHRRGIPRVDNLPEQLQRSGAILATVAALDHDGVERRLHLKSLLRVVNGDPAVVGIVPLHRQRRFILLHRDQQRLPRPHSAPVPMLAID